MNSNVLQLNKHDLDRTVSPTNLPLPKKVRESLQLTLDRMEDLGKVQSLLLFGESISKGYTKDRKLGIAVIGKFNGYLDKVDFASDFKKCLYESLSYTGLPQGYFQPLFLTKSQWDSNEYTEGSMVPYVKQSYIKIY
mgnify:CR=1 FL=1